MEDRVEYSLEARAVRREDEDRLRNQEPVFSDTAITIMISTGPFQINRRDLVDIGSLRYSYRTVGENFEYTYTFRNIDVALFRLGDLNDVEHGVVKCPQTPKKWMDGRPYAVWSALEGAEYLEDATYTIVSTRRPGLIPMFFQSVEGVVGGLNGQTVETTPAPASAAVVAPIPHRVESRASGMRRRGLDVELMASVESIFFNSLRRFVIGPVFAGAATRAEVLAKVQLWIDEYGFDWLRPLLDLRTSEDQSVATAAIDSLRAPDAFGRDVVECIRQVL